MRALDWAATPLGPTEHWPESLRTLTEVMLAATQPMFVTWGPQRITLYNDRYAEVLADRHPRLGCPIEEVWPEIWESDLKDLVARAYGGEAIHMADITLQMHRNGVFEEAHFSFSYTPVRDGEGGVQGFFCPCHEITEAVREERRTRFREALNTCLRQAVDPVTMAYEAAGLLARHLGAQQAALATVDAGGETAAISRDWNDGTMRSNAGLHRLADFGAAFIADLHAGRSVAIADVTRDGRTAAPEARATFADRGIAAFLNVPHLRDGRLTSVLAVHAAAPRQWHAPDIALAHEVAERVNSAVDRAEAERSLRDSEARLRLSEERHAFVLRLSDAIRDLRSVAEVMRAASRILGDHLGASFVGFAEVDGAGHVRTDGQYHARAERPAFFDRSFALDSFSRRAAATLRAGKTFVAGDVATSGEFTAQERDAMREIGIMAVVASPILWRGRLEAYLFAACDQPRQWLVPEVALVRETAARTFSALERARAEAALVDSEARFRALVHSTSDIAFRVSADWSELEHIDEHGRPLQKVGSDWIDTFVAPEDQPAVRATLAAAIAEGAPVDLEHRWNRSDGSVAWIRMRAVPLRDASGAIREWFGASTDVTESKRSEHSQRLLLSELDHRVKNILAVVQSIAQQTLGRGNRLPDEGRRLIGRISALAESHRLLARSSWRGASFCELIEGAVAPHRHENPGRITAEGPDLQINPRAAQTLVLALHELVTNAAKYGALSTPDGVLRVVWDVTGSGEARLLRLLWLERGGPRIDPAPERRGFGSRLLEQTLAFELEGRATLDFAPEGLRAVVELPVKALGTRQAALHAAEVPPALQAAAADGAAVAGKRVLVVEDEHLVAHETAAVLSSAGCTVVGPVASVAAAVEAISATAPDAAVLDINLGTEFVWPVALLLQARGVPFVFVSGYAAPLAIPQGLAGVLRLEKPLAPDMLLAGLAQAVSQSPVAGESGGSDTS